MEKTLDEARRWKVTSISTKLRTFSQAHIVLSVYFSFYLLATLASAFFHLVMFWEWEQYYIWEMHSQPVMEVEYPLMLQANCLWFVIYLYWLVGPRRERVGLFWIQEEGEWESGFDGSLSAHCQRCCSFFCCSCEIKFNTQQKPPKKQTEGS